jgi:high-affinity nickel permease
MAAMSSHAHVPPLLVLLLPLLFAVGMSLLDTLDGLLMIVAYGWALLHPARKVYYNLFLSGVSAFIALLVAVLQILGCIGQALARSGGGGGAGSGFWALVTDINEHFAYVGVGIIVFFVCSSVGAVLAYQCCVRQNAEKDEDQLARLRDAAQQSVERAREKDDAYIRARLLDMASAASIQSRVDDLYADGPP